MEDIEVAYSDVERAHKRIAPFINHTPVITSSTFDSMFDSSLFFKCENLQKVGAFKFRGATNAVLSLTDEGSANGVATHSSGNHAQALALAARNRGIAAYIVMPSNSPKVKVDAVRDYGAEITFCEPTLSSRETTLQQVVERTGAKFIHPYNDPRIIAGHGTAAKELIEDVGDLDIVMAPVGGGGLLSGTSIATKHLLPRAKVIAVEPEMADDAYRSFKAKRLIPSEDPLTIADGLKTSLGDLTFKIIMKNVDEIVTVSEEDITKAMRMTWERMKLIIEPSSAVVLASLLATKVNVEDKRVGLILSGGNVDLDSLPW